MTQSRAIFINKAFEELKKLKKEHSFPDHIVALAGHVSAMAGVLVKNAIELKYMPPESEEGLAELKSNLEEQAWRTLAMTMRFLQEITKDNSVTLK